MNLLGAKAYDPSSAATKATTALLAMTAFDTTNLRLTVTVPAHGMLRFRICVASYNTAAGSYPSILLGVLSGATVVGRAVPLANILAGGAANKSVGLFVDFTVTGLSPGSITLDAAYAVQVVQASSAIKYGGPDDNSGNDAWGALVFEIYDPQPLGISSAALVIDSAGRLDISKIEGTDATDQIRDAVVSDATRFAGASVAAIKAKTDNLPADPADASDIAASFATVNTNIAAVQSDTDDIQTKLPSALVGGRMDSSVGAMAADTITDAAYALATGKKVIRSGTAISGTSTQIRLDAGASAVDSFYVGCLVVITGGTGVGQARIITVYVGALTQATVDRAWATQPNGTSTFAILPAEAPKLDSSLRTTDINSSATIASNVTAIKAKTDNLPADPASAATVAAEIAAIPADVWAEILEAGFDASRILRIAAAAVAGKSTGGTFRNLADDEDQITGTATVTGDRTSVSYGS